MTVGSICFVFTLEKKRHVTFFGTHVIGAKYHHYLKVSQFE